MIMCNLGRHRTGTVVGICKQILPRTPLQVVQLSQSQRLIKPVPSLAHLVSPCSPEAAAVEPGEHPRGVQAVSPSQDTPSTAQPRSRSAWLCRYAGPKVRVLNEQFIELFDCDLVSVPLPP